MIAHLTGTVLSFDQHSVILDVSGVGYRLFVTDSGLIQANRVATDEPLSFHTHLAVRENAMDLYGFLDEKELQFFNLLLSVSGIGPKSALSILNIAEISVLQNAILQNDSSYLTKVSGIGAKSAQKIVLELQGKLDGALIEGAPLHEDADALDALTALGYSQNEARNALKDVPSDVEGTDNRLKHALKSLGK